MEGISFHMMPCSVAMSNPAPRAIDRHLPIDLIVEVILESVCQDVEGYDNICRFFDDCLSMQDIFLCKLFHLLTGAFETGKMALNWIWMKSKGLLSPIGN